MKGMTLFRWAVVLAIAGAAGVGQAATTTVSAQLYLNTVSPDVTGTTGIHSTSTAAAQNGALTDNHSQDLYAAITAASATAGSASSTAQTSAYGASVTGTATAAPGASAGFAAHAEQSIDSAATIAGTYQFDIHPTISLNPSSFGPGDWIDMDAKLTWSLYDASHNLLDAASDEQSWHTGMEEALTVLVPGPLESWLDAGQGWTLTMTADISGTVCSPVPVPGALLLAGMGASLAGCLRRRRAI
jgi:hypothetical protein